MLKPDLLILLRNRFMRVILLSGLFLQIGIWVRNFAVLLFVMEKTGGNALAVSMISVAEFGPIFVFSLIGGTFADRWRPKRTMIWCEFLGALFVFVTLIALIFTDDWKAIFLSTLFSAIFGQFSMPAGTKLFKIYIPAEQVQTGMSLSQTLYAVFAILGPVLGTFVYQNLGINISMMIIGGVFLLSAVILLFLPSDHSVEVEQSPAKLHRELLSGIRYVLSKKTLTLLGACLVTLGLGCGLTQPLGIFLVTERLSLAKEFLQWLLSAYGAGMVLGSISAVSMSKTVSPQKMLVMGLLVSTVCTMVLSWSTILWLTLLVEFFNGLVFPANQISINTMIMKNTEASFMGRVGGILMPLFTGSMVIAMSCAGGLKQMFPIAIIYQVSALLLAIGLFSIIPIYRLRNMMSSAEGNTANPGF